MLGCSKLNDSEKPVITILSPNPNDTIPASTSEVILQFTATDNTALSSLSLEINDTNGNNFFTDSKELDGEKYSYKNSFMIVKQPTKTKALIFSIQLTDENKNQVISNSTFYISPSK